MIWSLIFFPKNLSKVNDANTQYIGKTILTVSKEFDKDLLFFLSKRFDEIYNEFETNLYKAISTYHIYYRAEIKRRYKKYIKKFPYTKLQESISNFLKSVFTVLSIITSKGVPREIENIMIKKIEGEKLYVTVDKRITEYLKSSKKALKSIVKNMEEVLKELLENPKIKEIKRKEASIEEALKKIGEIQRETAGKAELKPIMEINEDISPLVDFYIYRSEKISISQLVEEIEQFLKIISEDTIMIDIKRASEIIYGNIIESLLRDIKSVLYHLKQISDDLYKKMNDLNSTLEEIYNVINKMYKKSLRHIRESLEAIGSITEGKIAEKISLIEDAMDILELYNNLDTLLSLMYISRLYILFNDRKTIETIKRIVKEVLIESTFEKKEKKITVRLSTKKREYKTELIEINAYDKLKEIANNFLEALKKL